MAHNKSIYVGLDFDGTVVKHMFPITGDDIPHAVEVLKELINKGIKIVLNTMRSGKYLDEAVKWCNDRGIELYGINNNPTQSKWTTSPKVFAHIYVDDAALGCPLIFEGDRPYVDWKKVRELFVQMGILN